MARLRQFDRPYTSVVGAKDDSVGVSPSRRWKKKQTAYPDGFGRNMRRIEPSRTLTLDKKGKFSETGFHNTRTTKMQTLASIKKNYNFNPRRNKIDTKNSKRFMDSPYYQDLWSQK